MRLPPVLVTFAILAGCGPDAAPIVADSDDLVVDTFPVAETDVADTDPIADSDVAAASIPACDTPLATDVPPRDGPPDPFADHVACFSPGRAGGFGADALPDIVLGAPDGRGELQGGVDIVSLGEGGSLVLGLDAPGLADGPGVDLIVFENAFSAWRETGIVAVSADGVSWSAFPCDPAADGALGCAGTHPVLSSRDNGIDPTDPAVAGGDPFDLADLDLPDGFVARFVRVTDSGANDLGGLGYSGTTGGFDLDAIAVVNAGASTVR